MGSIHPQVLPMQQRLNVGTPTFLAMLINVIDVLLIEFMFVT